MAFGRIDRQAPNTLLRGNERIYCKRQQLTSWSISGLTLLSRLHVRFLFRRKRENNVTTKRKARLSDSCNFGTRMGGGEASLGRSLLPRRNNCTNGSSASIVKGFVHTILVHHVCCFLLRAADVPERSIHYAVYEKQERISFLFYLRHHPDRLTFKRKEVCGVIIVM